jgi:CHAD domain-containing protein
MARRTLNGVSAPRATRKSELFRGALSRRILRRLDASLKTQWKRYRKKLRRCQKSFSEDAVHDTRVEARRLVSLLELLSPFMNLRRARKVERLLKGHLDVFDDLRDTQVLVLAVGKMLRAFPSASAFYAHLLERERALTRSTRKNVKEVRTQRLGKLVRACRAEVESRRQKTAPEAVQRLLAAAVHRAFTRTEQLRRRIDPRYTKTIHRTRIAFKRFRYMMETLAEYLPGTNDKLLDRMHQYQTMMGDIQDAEVLLQALQKFLRKQKIEPVPMRPFLKALIRRRHDLIRIYLIAAAELTEFWPG